MSNLVQPPFPIFTDANGKALDQGDVYIGQLGLNPVANPVTAYWDYALTIPATQPIQLSSGLIVRNGTPARLYVVDPYSIGVYDKKGSLVYSSLDSTTWSYQTSDEVDALVADVAADVVTLGNTVASLSDSVDDRFDSVADDINTVAAATPSTRGKEAADGIGSVYREQGDLLYATGGASWDRLPKGTAGQVLVQNAGETAPEWATVAGLSVVTVANLAALPNPGSANVIYVTADTNKQYRLSAAPNTYIEISASLVLGDLSTNAYRGDRGKIAYDAVMAASASRSASKIAKMDSAGTVDDLLYHKDVAELIGQKNFVDEYTKLAKFNKLVYWFVYGVYPNISMRIALWGDNLVTPTILSIEEYYKLKKIGSIGNGDQGKADARMHEVICTRFTGIWVTGAAPQLYTIVPGSTFEIDFYGSFIEFYQFGDNRGGLWSFELVETGATVEVSVWKNSVPLIGSRLTVFEDLNAATLHTIIATFIGADPLHAPTGGTARGWLYNAKFVSDGGLAPIMTSTKTTSHNQRIIDAEYSEMAVNILDGGDSIWFPRHSALDIPVEVEDAKYYVDEVEIDVGAASNTTNSYTPHEASMVRVRNHLYGDDAGGTPFVELMLDTIVDKYGRIRVEGTLEFLQEVYVTRLIGPMFPIVIDIVDEMVSAFGTRKINEKNGGNFTFSTEKDKCQSFLGIDSGNPSLFAAFSTANHNETARVGLSLKNRDTQTYAWMKATEYMKLYSDVITANTVPIGTVYNFSGAWSAGNMNGSYEIET